MEMWRFSKQGGGWNPGFERPFNDQDMSSVEDFFGPIRDRRERVAKEDKIV